MTLLEVRGLDAFYGDFQALFGLTLDVDAGETVALIASLKTAHAIIWIEHIPHALRAVADRIMVLHFGRNVLDGPPAEVMTNALVREIYMGFRADDAP